MTAIRRSNRKRTPHCTRKPTIKALYKTLNEMNTILTTPVKSKTRYKYVPTKHGIELANIGCPICESPINWTKNVNNIGWNSKVILLAECWGGTNAPRHLFLIKIDENQLPVVEISRY